MGKGGYLHHRTRSTGIAPPPAIDSAPCAIASPSDRSCFPRKLHINLVAHLIRACNHSLLSEIKETQAKPKLNDNLSFLRKIKRREKRITQVKYILETSILITSRNTSSLPFTEEKIHPLIILGFFWGYLFCNTL